MCKAKAKAKASLACAGWPEVASVHPSSSMMSGFFFLS